LSTTGGIKKRLLSMPLSLTIKSFGKGVAACPGWGTMISNGTWMVRAVLKQSDEDELASVQTP
jgi:hypothetical protein